MRRLFTVFLLFVLPLQFCWAVAASHCQHEGGVQGGGHFGHHEHRHADAGAAGSHAAASTDEAPSDGASLSIDSDCAYCHLGQLTPLPAAVPLVGDVVRSAFGDTPPNRIDSHVVSPRERPDWRA